MSIPQHHLSTVLREDYTTISVVFSGNAKQLTYKVHESQLPLIKVGSRVVVPGKMKDDNTYQQSIATVVEIHDKPQLDLTLEVKYAWMIAVVDTSLWDMLMAQDAEMDTKLMAAARTAAKKRAIEELLADLAPADREQFMLDMKGTLNKGAVDVEAKQVD